jgi:hypothetical protein
MWRPQYRKSLPLQSGFQEHLGSAHHRDGVGSDPGRHGNHRCRSRERNRLDRQLSVHAHQQIRIPRGQAVPLCHRRDAGIRSSVANGTFRFPLPVKGSFGALALGTLLYVFSTCGFGQLISTFTQTQVAAVFATVVLSVIPTVNFSGLITPVSSLAGGGRIIGLLFPAAWYQPISIGTFTKGLGYSDLWFNALVLVVFTLSYLIAAHIMLSKQES